MSRDAATRTLRVGLTQFHPTRDVERNLVVACRLLARAGRDGADLVLLPENALMLGTNAEMRSAAFSLDSSALSCIARAAALNRVTVVLGGVKVSLEGESRPRNRALIYGPDGRSAGQYDKIHLFDAQVEGQSFEASSVEQAGSTPVLLDVGGTLVGLTICYDLRFPELYRQLALAGAEVVLAPSAFTRITGRAHWETLLRARAIENELYVVASATIGTNEDDAFQTYGHASVIDPWGEVVVDLEDAEEACRVVELDIGTIGRVREMLPVLKSVRPDAYVAPVARFSTVDDRGGH
ncbi:MAG: nitrilase-related carbon-nitrogen hydrolase [Acidimicrobiales bacterium]